MVTLREVESTKMQSEIDQYNAATEMKRVEIEEKRARVELLRATTEAIKNGKITNLCAEIVQRVGAGEVRYGTSEHCYF